MACCGQKMPPICPPARPASLQETKLLDGYFNCGMTEWRGKRYLASRDGWANAKVVLHHFDDWRPTDPIMLDIRHKEAMSGVEDPRLFVWNDRMHVACTGYVHGHRTTQLVARLDEDLTVKKVWVPQYQGRQPWEKNWSFFADDKGLHCVYSIYPYHTVLTFNGNCLDCVLRAEFSPGLLMRVSHLRGGAPPVMHNGEWYHWFHTVMTGRVTTYSLGLYTFSPVPPYRPLRMIHRQLLTAQELTKDRTMRVVYPCGAMLEGDKWRITYGKNDCECWLATIDAQEIEGMLV